MRFLMRLVLVFVAITAVISVVRGLFSSAGSSPDRQARRAAPPTRSSGKLTKDPVCGTYVSEGSAVQAEGMSFCSEECRQKFLQKA